MINKKKFFLMMSLSSLILIVGTWFSIGVINEQGKKEVGKFISTVNLTTQQNIHSWADRHYTLVMQEAQELSPLIDEVIIQARDSIALTSSSIHQQLHSYLSVSLSLEEYMGFDILGEDNLFLFSSEIERIGKHNFRYEQKDVLERIWNGETLISPPFYANENDSKALIIFIGTPVVNQSNVVAILLFTIDLNKEFMRIFEYGRIGKSGENYAIDNKGRLLSRSRFADQLKVAGLIKSEGDEILNTSVLAANIHIFNDDTKSISSDSVPLSDLKSHYFAKISGTNLDGYSDYRGVNVVGVWTWDEELNIGIVTELDTNEAFKVFNSIQSVIMGFFVIGLIIFIIVGLVYYYWFMSIDYKEKTFEDLFNNSPLGIYQTSPSGKILMANQTLLDMVGYDSLSELQTRNLEEDGYTESSPVTREEFKEKIEKDGFVKGMEEDWKTKDGEIIHVRENARAIHDMNGNILYYEGTVEDISELKKAKEELISQKEFLKTIIDTSPNFIFVKDWEGRFTLVNKRMARLFDCSVEDMIGRTELEINPNMKEAEKFLLEDREVLKSLQSKINSEEVFIDQYTGKKYWFRITKIPLLLPNGRAEQILGVVTDITSLKQTEETVRRITDRLQLATQTANIGIWDLDVVNNILEWDEAMYSLYGITSGTFSGVYEAWESGLHPDDKEKAESELQKALRGEKEFNTEFRVLWSDNSVHHIKAIGLVQRNDKGEAVRMLGTNWDITELKKNEEEIIKHREHLEVMVAERTRELTVSEQRLQQSLKDITDYKIALNVSSIVSITDVKGIILFVNDNYCKISKYNQDELLGQNHRLLNAGHHPKEFFEDLWGTICSGKTWRGEVKNKAKDGGFYWLDTSIIPFLNEDGEPYQFMSIRADITDKKLIEEDLIKAKEEADSANRAKSEFLANMSHEIRTPMNAVIGFSDLLIKSVTDEKQKSQVKSIRSSGKNLLKIINDILDLSKIEAGKIDIEPTPVNLYSLVSEVENMFVPKVKEKGILFGVRYESKIQNLFLLDEVRLRQILFNLIGNAIKFTDEGQVLVCVRERENHQDKEKVDLIISIEDTAMGISADQQELIFEPFVQQTGQSLKYVGTGLGLSITKKLIEKMGGSISLESEVGKGSIFTIIIPSVSLSDDETVSADNTFDYSAIRIAEAKILLVDDEAEDRKLMVDMLEYSQLTIFEATNGKEAVEIAMEHLPDLILMDLRMPVMNGYEATKKLKSMQSTESIPVIAISASASKGMPDNSSKKIFNEYLMKPIDVSKLFNKITKYLKYETLEKTLSQDTEGINVVLTEKQINNLPELIAQLENEFMPAYYSITKSRMIDEIEKFGKDLRVLAEDSKIEYLLNYATDICILADNFEIDKLVKTLDGFPRIIEQLKMNKPN